jgi:hypothetical protein
LLKKLSQYYQLFCNLSLDVVAGVFFLMLPLPRYLGFEEPIAWYVSLPAATWLIYINDHWLDNFNPDKQPSQRHLFIFRNYKFLLPLQVLLIGVSVALVLKEFDSRSILYGIVFSIVCMGYLGFIHLFYKEGKWKDTLVSFIYPAGIFLYPFLQNLDHMPALFFIANRFTVLLIATYINLKTTTYFEHNCTNKTTRNTILVWSFIALLVAASGYIVLDRSIVFLLVSYLLIIAGHLLLLLKPELFRENERFRKWSEALFWIPGILYLCFP